MAYDNPLALSLLKKFEGYTPRPAWDHKQYSVGFGTKWVPGQPIGGRAEHEAALAREAGAVDGWLAQNVKVPLNDQQRAALTSAGYNLGTGPKGLGRLLGDINAGSWDRVGQRLLSFNKASGQVNPGLVKRRAAEAALLTGNSSPESYIAANATNEVTNNGAPMATPIGGAPIAGGPVPLNPPSQRKSKLAEALLASGAGAKPKNWGDLLNAAGDLTLGYVLGDQYDTEQKDYRGKLAEALSGATNETLPATLIGTGDEDLMKQGVAMRVAQAKPESQVGRFKPTKYGVVDSTTGKIVPGTEKTGDAEASEYGTDAKQYRDKDGNIVYTQLSKAGGRKDVELPEGAKWLSGVDKIDTGTEIQLRDKKTGEVVASQPKDLAGAEAQKAVGKEAGQAQVAIPAAKTTVENAFKTIGELEKHPGLEAGTGLSNVTDPRSWTPGTDAYNFLTKNKQAQAQSFMGAREALKGAGQVTDFEGERGQTAIAALDAAQSKEQYLAALQDLKRMMQASYNDLQTKAGMAGGPAAAPAASGTKRGKYNPATGEIE